MQFSLGGQREIGRLQTNKLYLTTFSTTIDNPTYQWLWAGAIGRLTVFHQLQFGLFNPSIGHAIGWSA